MNGVSVPLHLDPDDYSPEACWLRVALHVHMAGINPKGWRKPHTSRRRRKLPQPMTRISSLSTLARLAGKAGTMARLKKALIG